MKNNAVDDYIKNAPEQAKAKLKEIRQIIQEAAPDALEKISYAIPTFELDGTNLVHFAGFAKHVGFYPGASGIANFKEELSKYKSAKGSVQFPLDQPLPKALIKRIVKSRVKENRAARSS